LDAERERISPQEGVQGSKGEQCLREGDIIFPSSATGLRTGWSKICPENLYVEQVRKANAL
jgi:hypothetical protein